MRVIQYRSFQIDQGTVYGAGPQHQASQHHQAYYEQPTYHEQPNYELAAYTQQRAETLPMAMPEAESINPLWAVAAVVGAIFFFVAASRRSEVAPSLGDTILSAKLAEASAIGRAMTGRDS